MSLVSVNTPIFRPAPDLADKVIESLCSPDLSFRQVAAAYDTTVAALSAWIARDDVREQLFAIASGAAEHARLVAAVHVSTAVGAAKFAMDQARELLKAAPPLDAATTDAPEPAKRSANRLTQFEFRRRLCETSRLSAGVMLRIARFNPVIAVPREPAASRQPAPARTATVAPGASHPAPPQPTPAAHANTRSPAPAPANGTHAHRDADRAPAAAVARSLNQNTNGHSPRPAKAASLMAHAGAAPLCSVPP